MEGKVGEILKGLRLQHGLTQMQVANILKMDRSTYTYYEVNKTQPNISSLKKLAKIYKTTIDELVGYEPEFASVLKEPTEAYKSKGLALSDDEKILLLNFRLLSEEDQNKHLQQIQDDVDKLEN